MSKEDKKFQEILDQIADWKSLGFISESLHTRLYAYFITVHNTAYALGANEEAKRRKR